MMAGINSNKLNDGGGDGHNTVSPGYCSDDDSSGRFSDTEFNPYRRKNNGHDPIPETITSITTTPGQARSRRNNREAPTPMTAFSVDENEDQMTAQVTPERGTVRPNNGSLSSIRNASFKKEETDDENEDLTTTKNDVAKKCDDNSISYPKIKEEPTIYEIQQKAFSNERKYGDRVLLARQAPNGMMKLGGGNTTSHIWPKDPDQHLARFNGRYVMGYNDLWNFGVPRFAGQPFGHVTMYPYDDHNRAGYGCDPINIPFSVFAKRTVKGSALGWEYCGEYVLSDDLPGVVAAHCVTRASKSVILKDMLTSLAKPAGHWIEGIEIWQKKVLKICSEDDSPAGPTRLRRLAVQKKFQDMDRWDDFEIDPQDEGKARQDREDKESKEKATSAAKARALGIDDKELSQEAFARRIIHFDEFYKSYTIKFVEYDEKMYDYVKAGETTKNKSNKTREEGEPCAKARDWYAICDQMLTENDRAVRKARKRHRVVKGENV